LEAGLHRDPLKKSSAPLDMAGRGMGIKYERGKEEERGKGEGRGGREERKGGHRSF